MVSVDFKEFIDRATPTLEKLHPGQHYMFKIEVWRDPSGKFSTTFSIWDSKEHTTAAPSSRYADFEGCLLQLEAKLDAIQGCPDTIEIPDAPPVPSIDSEA